MSSLRACAVAVLASHCVFAEEPISTIECKAKLLNEFPMTSASGGCRDYTMVVPQAVGDGVFVEQVSCHFSNNLSAYAYQRGHELLVDLKGFSGGRLEGLPNAVNHTETFSDCESLSNRLREFSILKAVPSFQPTTNDFQSRDSVLVVASQDNCDRLDAELRSLISLYQQEQRGNSSLLCLSRSLISRGDPSEIRRSIRSRAKAADGILLIGSDIPPFEYFYRTGWSGGWSPYKYGMTDLPYGSLDDRNAAWSKPLSKARSWLREEVYKSQDYVYKIDTPTRFAFDFDEWIKTEQKNAQVQYRQDRWVARFLVDPAQIKERLVAFLKRRMSFKPSTFLNFVYGRGSQGFMLRPGENDSYDRDSAYYADWISTFPRGSHPTILMETDLDQLIRFIDPAVNFLVMMDHGQPQGFGNLNSDSLAAIRWLPSLVHYDSCLTGAWGYADSAADSLVAKTFQVEVPPLALIASQGIKSLPTIGSGTKEAPNPFLSRVAKGKTLGLLQKESIADILAAWREQNPGGDFKGEVAGNVFHSTSLFGDGTWEF